MVKIKKYISIIFFALIIVSACEANFLDQIPRDFAPIWTVDSKMEEIEKKIDGLNVNIGNDLATATYNTKNMIGQSSIFNNADSKNTNSIYPYFLKTLEYESQLNKKNKDSTDNVSVVTEYELFEEIFPIIIYDVSNTNIAFKHAKSWGATHVHRYGMGRSVEKDKTFFDRAAEHGLKVMSDLRGRYWLKEKQKMASLRNYIRHFKNHPAMGFWYLCDEPDNKGFSPAEIAPFYEMIREMTPEVPVALAHAWTKNWYRYGNVQDILMYDSYPVYKQPFPKVRLDWWANYTVSAINRGRKDNDAVIPVIQIFNWKAMAKKGQEEIRGRPVEELRYPNYEELRYMSFTSIALGAKGLSFYSYARSRMIDENWAGHVLAPVIHEAKAFSKQIKDKQLRQISQSDHKGIFITIWEGEKESFLILVNSSSEPRQVKQSLGGILKSGLLEPWGQTREAEVSLSNGRIVLDQIKPWEVLIWRVETS